MDVIQHDYYFWKVIHHYICDLGFRVLDRNEKQVWLEDESRNTSRVI